MYICMMCIIMCIYCISMYILQNIYLYMSVKVKDNVPVFGQQYFISQEILPSKTTQNILLVLHSKVLFEFQGFFLFSLLTACMSRMKITRNPLIQIPAVETLQRVQFFFPKERFLAPAINPTQQLYCRLLTEHLDYRRCLKHVVLSDQHAHKSLFIIDPCITDRQSVVF